MEIFNFIIAQVLFVYAIQAFDVSIPLVFEGLPVKRGCGLDGEAVGSGLVNGLGDGSSVPSNFLWYAAIEFNQLYVW